MDNTLAYKLMRKIIGKKICNKFILEEDYEWGTGTLGLSIKAKQHNICLVVMDEKEIRVYLNQIHRNLKGDKISWIMSLSDPKLAKKVREVVQECVKVSGN